MKEYVEILVYFMSSYISTFILYYYLFNSKKKRKESFEIDYMINKFGLKRNKINYKKVKWILNFINPLIISIAFVAVMMIDSFTMGIMVGFVIMLVLIYSVYEIIGRILRRKEDRNV